MIVDSTDVASFLKGAVMKRIMVVIALSMLFGTQSLAKNVDIYVPSTSGKIEIMEELGLVDHVDPLQYDRAHGINGKKQLVAVRARTKKTPHRREIVSLNANE
jgi:hypothetical protein